MKPKITLPILWAGLAGLMAGFAVAEPMTLDQALTRALEQSPEVETASRTLRAADARTHQAGAFPNPELEFEVEEYDRAGEGFDSVETTVAVGQAIELGGKRGARKRVARLEYELLRWDYEAALLHTRAETRMRFLAALAAQQRAALAETTTSLAEKSAQAVQERVKAGREPPLQASKALAELEMARMNRQEAERALAATRRKLAAMWGQTEPDFETVAGDLHDLPEGVPALESLQARLTENPDLARWVTQRQLRDAEWDAARAARIPDLEASVGYSQFEEDGTDALAFGVGFSLPLFDRNQGDITAAAHDRAGAEAASRAAEVTLKTELAEIHANLAAAHARASVFGDKVVPTMSNAFTAAQEGYRQGKLGYLEVLDAQRSLADARRQHLDALVAYHLNLTQIDRLTVDPTLNSEIEQ